MDSYSEDLTKTLTYLKDEFDNQKKIEIINIYPMKNTNGLFLSITDNSITEKYLNKNLNVICHASITWTRHINTNTITQCRRCQQWGGTQPRTAQHKLGV